MTASGPVMYNGSNSTPGNSNPYFNSDVLLQNVRFVKFDVSTMDVPLGMPVDDDNTSNLPAPSTTDLYPRQLPSGVRLDITYGPDQGDLDNVTTATLYFTIYRGL
jgi:hypothetical protein